MSEYGSCTSEFEARVKAFRSAALAAVVLMEAQDAEGFIGPTVGECAVDDGSGDVISVCPTAFPEHGWQAVLRDRQGVYHSLGRELVEAAGYDYHGPSAVYASRWSDTPYQVCSLFVRH